MTDATNRLTNERIAEATDEEVRKIKRAVFRYRYAWGYRETEHSECIDDLEKLLARLERVEGELKKATEARVNMNRGENLNRPR